MKQPYCIGIDVWEGQLEINESILKQNNVKFMFIRLNDINGGHHRDLGFDKQWAEASAFYRAPYFVFNPWKNGIDNFNWLETNMPADAKAVAIDIEVKNPAVFPQWYAIEVSKFLSLVRGKWRYVIYTGEAYLPLLSSWEPRDYWWAQYPYLLYPATKTETTWERFIVLLETLSGPFNAGKCPGKLLFWQCSGDRFVLPGTTRPIDVNVYFGDEAGLAEFFGESPVEEPTEESDAMIEDAIRDAATLLVAKMGEEIAAIHELTEAVKAGGTTGGGTTPPSTDKLFTVHRVIEKDSNINRKVVVTKVPDDNDTNKDTIWMGSKPQEIKVYSRWQDVPASLVYWKDLDEIHKMNTYDEWACAVSTWMYNANGVRIPFPEIYIAGGTERAKYYWLHRSCLGWVLRYE